jgi:hypothetical protein
MKTREIKQEVMCADAVVAAGALQPLLTFLGVDVDEQPACVAQLRATAAWAVGNLCRGRPSADVLTLTLPVLSQLLRRGACDTETKVSVAWCLSYLSDGGDEQIEHVLAANVAPSLVEILAEVSPTDAVMPALRSVGNLVSGSDVQTQV